MAAKSWLSEDASHHYATACRACGPVQTPDLIVTVLVLSCVCLLVVALTSVSVAADWVRIDVFAEEESELPNIFLDFDSFRDGAEATSISARLINPDSSYVELVVKFRCAGDEFDVPLSKFYSREGVLINSDPVAEPQWMTVPRGSHIDFIKFFLCSGSQGKAPREFGKMRGFRDFVLTSRASGERAR